MMIIDRPKLKKVAMWAGLVLILALGSYYVFSGGKDNGEGTPQIKNTAVEERPADHSVASSFCSRYRMERQQVRSREVSLLNQVLDEGTGESQARGDALQRLVQISADMESEMKMENLVRCYGARDCVAMIEPDATTVVIASRPMKEKQTAEIKSELCKMLDCEESEISLIFQGY